MKRDQRFFALKSASAYYPQHFKSVRLLGQQVALRKRWKRECMSSYVGSRYLK